MELLVKHHSSLMYYTISFIDHWRWQATVVSAAKQFFFGPVCYACY